MTELWRLSVSQALAGLDTGAFSSLELVDTHLARIEAEDGVLKAFITLSGDRARQEARASDARRQAGATRGELEGVPFAVKDVTATQGVRTTFGSLAFADNVPDADELCVARLRAAGAVLIGKTNTPEFGFGHRSLNFLFGPTANPYNTALSSGGSSGGSATAVAAGLVPFAHGTDFGGSVRTPASFCGVAALRPTPGLIPSPGKAYAWNALATSGAMARNIDDVAAMTRIMAGFDARDPLSHPGDGLGEAPAPGALRLAYHPDLGVAPMAKSVREALSAAVARIAGRFPAIEQATPDLSGAPEAFATLRAALVRAQFGPLVAAHRERLTPPLVWNVERGADISADALHAAEARRSRAYADFLTFFERYDFLIIPAAVLAPFSNQLDDILEIDGVPLATPIDYLAITFLISLVGLPSLVIPAGSIEGAPFGVQIVAPPFAEAKLLAFGRALENDVGFRHVFPGDAY
jgi:amidase